MTPNPHHTTEQMISCAAQAWKRLALTPPCDLQAVCDFLKIRVKKRPMCNDIMGVFVRLSDGQEFIKLNAGLSPEQLRFTWAHEIAHSIMTTGPVTILTRTTFGEEQICSHFARNLLVPESVLQSECERLGHPENNRFGTLVELFGVSSDLMSERLEECGANRRQISREGRKSAIEVYKALGVKYR